MDITGMTCLARYQGRYIIGTIRKFDMKRGLCTLDTKTWGRVVVKSARVTLVRDCD